MPPLSLPLPASGSARSAAPHDGTSAAARRHGSCTDPIGHLGGCRWAAPSAVPSIALSARPVAPLTARVSLTATAAAARIEQRARRAGASASRGRFDRTALLAISALAAAPACPARHE